MIDPLESVTTKFGYPIDTVAVGVHSISDRNVPRFSSLSALDGSKHRRSPCSKPITNATVETTKTGMIRNIREVLGETEHKEGFMAKKLYVGNLNYRTTEEGLQAVFAEYGTVISARIVFDRETNRSKGFGFVEMEEDAAAEAAIQALDGQPIDGRNVRVNEAREREPRRERW